MSDCQPDDWITGLWFVVSGIVLSIAGCTSMFIIGPLLRE